MSRDRGTGNRDRGGRGSGGRSYGGGSGGRSSGGSSGGYGGRSGGYGGRSSGGSGGRSGGRSGGYGGRSGGSSGRSDRGPSGFRNRSDRPVEKHDAVCSNCGNACQVPFRPTGVKPVLCGDCYYKVGETKGKLVGASSEQMESVNTKLDQIIEILQALRLYEDAEQEDKSD